PGIPVPGTIPAAPGATPAAPAAPAGAGRDAILAAEPRIRIETEKLRGTLSLKGGRIDDLTLTEYRETVKPDSPPITLLSPAGTPGAFFAQLGWISADPTIPVPAPDTVWEAAGRALSPDQPVSLTWVNDRDVRFENRIAIDRDYMFTFTRRVVNGGSQALTLYPYGIVKRRGAPTTSDLFILHEGPLGVFDGTLREPTYSDVRNDGTIKVGSTGGWIGITDKYWAAVLVPDQKTRHEMRFTHFGASKDDDFQADYRGDAVIVAPGATVEIIDRVFAGAKVVRTLDRYEAELGIARFDRLIDFGWFYFLTKPIFHVLEYFHRLLGNFGLGILLLTVIIKLVFFPLANKSYKAMNRLKQLQPKMMELRDRYKDDRMRLNQAMMDLYKKENANPMSGCLPIVIQIPVFFALYKVLYVTIEMRHAPFYGWIKDLSAADPTSLFNLFGLLPFTPPELLHIGAWPLIMGVTMFLQQKLNPQPMDPMQQKIFMMLPIVFTFVLAQFSAGLVIYWAWNNLLSILQQWVIMKKMAAPVPAKT
ncbi:MAG: membrane protein insertase YidC, partial [Alphaproteobacteria bacterium]|nr:membrane protein insertase YidC [Alphaproteobacteria bacterium]